MKIYNIHRKESGKISTIGASCIKNAIKQFTCTLERPTNHRLYNLKLASVYYIDSCSTMSDYVIIEA